MVDDKKADMAQYPTSRVTEIEHNVGFVASRYNRAHLIGGTGMAKGNNDTGGQPSNNRRARTLLGWLERDEAVRLLIGHEPIPEDDRTQADTLYTQQKKAVASLQQRHIRESVVESATAAWGLEERTHDPALYAALAGLDWSLQVVDLRRVVAHQKTVMTDGLDGQIISIEKKDRKRILELCLPSEQPYPPSNLLRDADQKGFTVSSHSPNLRVSGSQAKIVQIAPAEGMHPSPVLAVTFFLSMGANYIKVVNYNGRDFLREGYHRTTALLRLGIHEVPCVYIKAQSLDELGNGRVTSLRSEILLGEHPPLLTDFWDDDVSATIDQPILHRAVRVTAEEFDVQE